MGLFGLVLLMFVVIAAVVVGTLLLMPGWKSALALFAVYAAGLLYVSLSPQLIEGQMERAALGPCVDGSGAWRDRPGVPPDETAL